MKNEGTARYRFFRELCLIPVAALVSWALWFLLSPQNKVIMWILIAICALAPFQLVDLYLAWQREEREKRGRRGKPRDWDWD